MPFIDKPLEAPSSFATLALAFNWAREQLKTHSIYPSVVWRDLFESYRPKGIKGRYVRLIGVEPKADKICQSLAVGGWKIEIKHDTFQAWYNRFMPYAVAMIQCEDGFECTGIEHTSIVTLYKTVIGFTDLGTDRTRILEEDCRLFHRVYTASMAVQSPGLPFTEAYNPCLVYVAMKNPKIIAKMFAHDHKHDHITHIQHVCEQLNEPRIKFW